MCDTDEWSLALLQVASVAQKTVTRNPQPPHITSTLQQDASAKLGFSPPFTMQQAQQLYEGSASPSGQPSLGVAQKLLSELNSS